MNVNALRVHERLASSRALIEAQSLQVFAPWLYQAGQACTASRGDKSGLRSNHTWAERMLLAEKIDQPKCTSGDKSGARYASLKGPGRQNTSLFYSQDFVL